MIGCVIALRADRPPDPKLGRLLTLGGLLMLLAALPLPSIIKLSQVGVLFLPSLLSTIGAAAIVAGRGADVPLLANPVIVGLGRISYGVYLWHWVVPRMASPVVEEPGRLLLSVFAVTAILIAAISFRWVETPALRLKARWSRSGQSPSFSTGIAPTT
jgi:peptidoglycan/LPS O-acetylase OafA/YrhL